MYITRRTLRNAGLEVTLDKQGLSIQGNTPIPDDVQQHVDAIAEAMHFNPLDHDLLREHIASTSVWTALRNCPTEL